MLGINISLFNSFKKGLIIIDTTKDSWFLEYIQERIILDLKFKPKCKYYIHTNKGIKGYIRLPLVYRKSIMVGELKLIPIMEFSKENPDKKYNTIVEKSLEELEELEELVNLIKK